jgi:phosphomannomutase
MAATLWLALLSSSPSLPRAARVLASFAKTIYKSKIELTPDIDVDAILAAVKTKYAHEQVTDIDGVKIDFAESWVHLRKSNTEPIIRIYAEAHTAAEAKSLADNIKSVIDAMVG